MSRSENETVSSGGNDFLHPTEKCKLIICSGSFLRKTSGLHELQRIGKPDIF